MRPGIRKGVPTGFERLCVAVCVCVYVSTCVCLSYMYVYGIIHTVLVYPGDLCADGLLEIYV